MSRPNPWPSLAAGLALSAALHAGLLACQCVGVPAAPTLAVATAGRLRAQLAGPAEAPSPVRAEAPPEAPPSAGNPMPASDPLPLPAALYLPARELTRRPQVMNPVDMDSPAFDAYSMPGKLTLRLFVSESGDVDAVVLEATDLPAAFAERAQAQFSRARLQPGEKDGRKVKSQMRIEVSFDPR